MSVTDTILKELSKKGKIKVSDITGLTGFSRAYINRYLNELERNNKILLIGKANNAGYIAMEDRDEYKEVLLKTHLILNNKEIEEHEVLKRIKRETRIFNDLKENIIGIVDYAFTEMLNNAIEHSKSRTIDIHMGKENGQIYFAVRDKGVGIFNNIMRTKQLSGVMPAIQDLLKGKETTLPSRHSGEGIFFTSKAADKLVISSFEKELIFDNDMKDIFVKNKKKIKGTKVEFIINTAQKRTLSEVFGKYTEDFTFNKTGVLVKLYKPGAGYISRSEARRLLTGLDKFKTIDMDFDKVETVGQAFADEIFRVWQGIHKDININYTNANENVIFMIKRARGN